MVLTDGFTGLATSGWLRANGFGALSTSRDFPLIQAYEKRLRQPTILAFDREF